MARLSGKPAELLCYEEVPEQLRDVRTISRGLQDIPIDSIVGSVGRCTDFTRSFLPLLDNDQTRWSRVVLAWEELAGLPPIDAYQIGQVYFVLDGNHRVSAAREMGLSHIQAYITQLHTRVGLSPTDSPDDLIVKAEYAEFLERTRLDELRPGVDLSMSAPGQHHQLEEEILTYRDSAETKDEDDLSYEEAVTSWYDTVYLPVVQIVRERGTLRGFRGRTEADLYVWVL